MRRMLAITIALAALVLAPGPAAAHGPPVVIQVQDSIVDVNPCTGQLATVTFDMLIYAHEFDNLAANRHHRNFRFDVAVTTSEGFWGKQVGVDIDNGDGLFGEEEGTGMVQVVFNAVLQNEAGQRVSVHFNAHLNRVDGEFIAFVQNFSARCLGAPA